jgi:hypothetical protein
MIIASIMRKKPSAPYPARNAIPDADSVSTPPPELTFAATEAGVKNAPLQAPRLAQVCAG